MLALPAQEAWVGTARSFVSFLVRHWRLSEDERDSAVLIVGELAANAAQHGHCDMVLSLALHADTLHITVTDSGEPRSAGRLQADPEERGRGIQIVESLATWTVILQGEHGRRVHAGLEVERESAECP
jgi:anti-sigma regulatory factor (Ser/Thr protein kinase)